MSHALEVPRTYMQKRNEANYWPAVKEHDEDTSFERWGQDTNKANDEGGRPGCICAWL